ncbi:hypothetical protein GGE16_003067 [Rhizobium leguminosarum]|uniref:Uncharacterized protein n=1 Tax=Rhizobium leguminosarum TaxID=384 RepID=A0AAE2MKD8_RHILE|nr:hypothetical protein [Rhizobium leguminosarum]MBB4430159.1 hypothetical protein [Rhizobium esperanzae]MBB4297896.1 hypothetical protein [Rhizobium leguminosarum]MBB4309035.1 hypothetical protein [Rhizobium leguminosarum]MBB4416872.1 hypothetical protein [Rhizobium leguminosarum]
MRLGPTSTETLRLPWVISSRTPYWRRGISPPRSELRKVWIRLRRRPAESDHRRRHPFLTTLTASCNGEVRPSTRKPPPGSSCFAIRPWGSSTFPEWSSRCSTRSGGPGRAAEDHQSTYVSVLCCTLFLQVCYRSRVRWVAVRVPFNNMVAAHLISFVARLSFLFGAFFLTIIFGPLPELGAFPPRGERSRAGCPSLRFVRPYCCSLELERFG